MVLQHVGGCVYPDLSRPLFSPGLPTQVVCAADLKARLGIEPAALYTFGQPRVGDREFSDALGNTGRAFRYVPPALA